jgi:hypothetical protein
MQGSKCWNCQNACTGCDWIDFQKPIDGWTAEKITIANNSNCVPAIIDSYIVKDCPNFRRDNIRVTDRLLAEAFGITRDCVAENRERLKRIFLQKYCKKAQQYGVRIVQWGVE